MQVLKDSSTQLADGDFFPDAGELVDVLVTSVGPNARA